VSALLVCLQASLGLLLSIARAAACQARGRTSGQHLIPTLAGWCLVNLFPFLRFDTLCASMVYVLCALAVFQSYKLGGCNAWLCYLHVHCTRVFSGDCAGPLEAVCARLFVQHCHGSQQKASVASQFKRRQNAHDSVIEIRGTREGGKKRGEEREGGGESEGCGVGWARGKPGVGE
jgi:hypothetical protein